jgi:hypothetical protein
VWTKKLQASPNTAAYGVMLEKFIATGVNGTVSVLTITLASSVRSTGQIMATMVKKDHQFGYVAPSGQGKIDFSQATIDVNAFPSFQAPAKSGELPPGADDFDWEAPDTKP